MLFPGLPFEQSAINQMTLTLSCKMTSVHSLFVSLLWVLWWLLYPPVKSLAESASFGAVFLLTTGLLPGQVASEG